MNHTTVPARQQPRTLVLGIALLCVLNLLGALGGGLVRLGTLPPSSAGPTGLWALQHHGAVMMAGFFGALIALERVVALQRGGWVSASAALGGLLHWTLGPTPIAPLALITQTLWIASALGLIYLYTWAARHRSGSLPLAVEGAGAVALLYGNVAYALEAPLAARLGWSAFLVLTIAGERRELMRLVRLPHWAARAFIGGLGMVAVALALAALGHGEAAQTVFWSAMGLLALWLLGFDVARRQWRAAGWAAHTARCLLVGYTWLLAAAVLALVHDAGAWHALWLGFVMCMVFGHAPIMLPALAGWRPRPTTWALLPLALLSASLALRLTAPYSAKHSASLFALAGAGHAVSLLLFGAVMAHAVHRSVSGLKPDPKGT